MPNQQTNRIEDIVVIGGGLMGSSVAWELAKHGELVLLLEQQDSVYTFGSSFGEARISRSLGPKNDIFSYLQQTSVAETKQLIAYLNEGNSGAAHSMEDIYSTSPVTYIYYKNQQEEINGLLEGQMDNHEFATTPEEALELFDMVTPDSAVVIREFKEYSGTLNPGVLIKKLHQAIQKSGGCIEYGANVQQLRKKDDGYEIELHTNKTGLTRTLRCKKLVVAAGPHNGDLMKELAPYFQSLITPKRTTLAFIKIKVNVYDNLSPEQKKRFDEYFPVAEMSGDVYYSMIENRDENGRPLLKVGGHFVRTKIDDLSTTWQKELSEQEIDWSLENTVRYMKILQLPIGLSDLEFIRGYSCVYSMTESEVPFVTNIFNQANDIDPNCVLVGGMSGVGAKGSLAYGLIAAHLLLKKNEPSPLYPCLTGADRQEKARMMMGSERLRADLHNADI